MRWKELCKNRNVEIAEVGEIVINENEQSDNGIQLRRPEIVPKIGLIIPVKVPGGVPVAIIANPKPHPPAPPVMVAISEVQETNVSSAPSQTNFNTGPASGSANKGGGKDGQGDQKRKEKEMI